MSSDKAGLARSFHELGVLLFVFEWRAVQALADDLLQDGAGMDGKIVIPWKSFAFRHGQGILPDGEAGIKPLNFKRPHYPRATGCEDSFS